MRKIVSVVALLQCGLGLIAAAVAQSAGHGASDVWALQHKVYFREGSASVDRHQTPALDSIVAAFRNDRTLRYEVRGHSDYASGRASENFQLSVARASSVKDYLTARGIPGRNVTISAYGKPAVNDPEQSGAEGRRVDIMLVTPRTGHDAPPPPAPPVLAVPPKPEPAPKPEEAPKIAKPDTVVTAPPVIQKLPNTQILDLDAIGYSIDLVAQPAPMFEEVLETDEPESEPEPEPAVEETVEAAAVADTPPVVVEEPVIDVPAKKKNVKKKRKESKGRRGR